jgi:hypothetical protein
MAVRRRKKKTPTAAEAYQQAMAAEGAPAALDLLGFGSTVGDIISGEPRKAATKRRRKTKKTKARKKPRAKAATKRTVKKRGAKRTSARKSKRKSKRR